MEFQQRFDCSQDHLPWYEWSGPVMSLVTAATWCPHSIAVSFPIRAYQFTFAHICFTPWNSSSLVSMETSILFCLFPAASFLAAWGFLSLYCSCFLLLSWTLLAFAVVQPHAANLHLPHVDWTCTSSEVCSHAFSTCHIVVLLSLPNCCFSFHGKFGLFSSDWMTPTMGLDSFSSSTHSYTFITIFASVSHIVTSGILSVIL